MPVSDSIRKLLIDYIDGNLSDGEAHKVEVLLSTDPDIYNEYKILKAITSTAHKCATSFEPSRDVTAKIFRSIGIASTAQPVAEKTVATHAGVFLSAVYKFALPVLASIVIFFSTDFAISNKAASNKFSVPEEYFSAYSGSITPVKSSIATKRKSNPVAKNLLKANKNIQPPITSSTFTQADPSEFASALEDNYAVPENNNEDMISFEEDYTDDYYNYSNTYTEIPYGTTALNSSATTLASVSGFALPQLTTEKYNFGHSFVNDIGLTVELKSSAYLNAQNSDKTDTKLKNIGVTVLSRVTRNVYVGIDVRNESFAVKADNTPAVSSKVLSNTVAIANNTTNISTTSVGVAVRYCAKSNSRDRLYANGDLIIAKNSKGTVGRAGLSLCYTPSAGLTTSVGIEYSDLSYQSTSYSSLNVAKLGLNYGISYNF